jgi:PIN domain
MPMLRHQMAAALLFGLQNQADAFIALPSVVRDEVLLHLMEKNQAAQRDVLRASGEIRQIFGLYREVERHSDDEVEVAFDERLRELSSLVEILQVTDNDLCAAGRMVFECRPPSSRGNQQYKDSVIWRVVLRAAEQNDVYFVTDDSGFYSGKDSNELTAVLAEEIHKLGRPVALFRNVESLLQHWSTNKPSLQTQALREIVSEAVAEELSSILPAHGSFIIQSCISAGIEVFLTEVHDQVSVSGVFEYYLVEPEFADVDEPPAAAEVRASATVGLDGPEVREVTLDNVQVKAITPHGEPNIANIIFGRAALSLGVRYEPYRLRAKLDLP